MPMLGDLLALAERTAGEFARSLRTIDADFAERCEGAAQAEGQSLEDWIAGSISQFERFADAEKWAGLTSRMMTSDEPGRECLLAMVEVRLDHIDHVASGDIANERQSEGQLP